MKMIKKLSLILLLLFIIIIVTAGCGIKEKAAGTVDVSGVQTVFIYTGETQSISGATGSGEISYLNNSFIYAGTYTVTVNVAESDNNLATSTTVVVTVNKADYDMSGVNWSYSSPYTYDGTEKTISVTNLPEGVTVDEYSNCSYTNAGSYTASVTFNYDLEQYNAPIMAYNWEIIAKDITITAVSNTKIYGCVDPELTYQVEGLINEDILTGALSRADGENVGQYDIVIGTLINSNYNINLESAVFTITSKAITLTSDESTKIYGEIDPELTYQAEGLIDGDSFEGTLSRTAGETIGNYAITLGSLNNINYDITFISSNFTITVKNITVNADMLSKSFGESDPELTYQAIGLVGEDRLSGELTRVAGEDIGEYTISRGTIDNSSYSITFIASVLIIYTDGLQFTDIAGGSKVSKGTVTDSDVYIPSVYQGQIVTTIGDFGSCSTLISITLPSTIINIEAGAFKYCVNLIDIFVDEDNESYKTFDGLLYNFAGSKLIQYPLGCPSLTFTVPENTSCISTLAFAGSCLTDIVVPDSILNIEIGAFSGCDSLINITIPFVGESINASDAMALFGYIFGIYSFGTSTRQYYTDTLSVLYYLPSSLTTVIVTGGTSIKYGAFYNCSTLSSLILAESTLYIDPYAFYNCQLLDSFIIPQSVTVLGDHAFSYCSNLASISILGDIENIGDGTFRYCSLLSSITIPESVINIGVQAFSYCDLLSSITIPENVISIGDLAFYACSLLSSINIFENVIRIGCYALDYTAWYINQPDGMVYAGKVLYFYKGEMPSDYNAELLNNTKGIADHAFNNRKEMKSITIPNSVLSIGNGSFANCENLTDIIFAENSSLIEIGPSAFLNCINLNCINIPYGVTNIDNGAFFNCSSLTEIVIPDSVTNIGYAIIQGCDSLVSISVPFIAESRESEHDLQFLYVFGDNSIYIPDTLREIIITDPDFIADRAFDSLSSSRVENIIIEGEPSYIGDYAFDDCKNIISISIPSSVIAIGEGAFNNCLNLANVNIPEGVIVIRGYTFNGCINLASIIIPESVIFIEVRAFSDCNNLISVTLEKNVPPSLGENIFGNTSETFVIYVPVESVNTYKTAAGWDNYADKIYAIDD